MRTQITKKPKQTQTLQKEDGSCLKVRVGKGVKRLAAVGTKVQKGHRVTVSNNG